MAAARQAYDDAKLNIGENADPDRVGVMIGSAFGGIGTVESEYERMQKRGPRRVSPFAIPALLGNTASGVVGIELNCRGPNRRGPRRARAVHMRLVKPCSPFREETPTLSYVEAARRR